MRTDPAQLAGRRPMVAILRIEAGGNQAARNAYGNRGIVAGTVMCFADDGDESIILQLDRHAHAKVTEPVADALSPCTVNRGFHRRVLKEGISADFVKRIGVLVSGEVGCGSRQRKHSNSNNQKGGFHRGNGQLARESSRTLVPASEGCHSSGERAYLLPWIRKSSGLKPHHPAAPIASALSAV